MLTIKIQGIIEELRLNIPSNSIKFDEIFSKLYVNNKPTRMSTCPESFGNL